MKKEMISCEIIQDLLPLYKDDCCSAASKKLVAEHLEECKACQEKSKAFQAELPFPEGEDSDPEERTIKNGIRRLKRIRLIGVSALLICFAVIFVVIPIIHDRTGTGVTYGNLKNLHMAERFLRALEEKDYEKAYGCLDISKHYTDLVNEHYAYDDAQYEEAVNAGIQTIKENGFAWYDEVCREKFMENMQAIETEGMLTAGHSLKGINKGMDDWYLTFSVQTEDGTSRSMDLKVGKGGISELSTQPFPFVYKEPDDPVELQYRYYGMPTLNETICEILYQDTDYDWRKLFN